MKVTCIGAGPAGLYLAILLRRAGIADVTVHERNAEGHSHGWGIIMWHDMLDSLADHDPPSAELLSQAAVHWDSQELHMNDRVTRYQGRGARGLERKRLLSIFADRARELGANLHFSSDFEPGMAPDAGLVVACDGIGSSMRQSHSGTFATEATVGRNKYIWLGTGKVFGSFTYALRRTVAGWIWFHGYPHSPTMSTCVVECAPETWSGLGFDTMPLAACVARLGEIFSENLDGHALAAGTASWQNFTTITNRRWHHGTMVLAGDAAHTAHFSIGSGTKLALEDAIALARHLGRPGGIAPALAAYERERIAAIRQLQSEARFSRNWFENIERYVTSDHDRFFTLMRERRSPLLSRIPPGLYFALHRATLRAPALGKIRGWIGPRARALYSRWDAR
jgi:2-polyprenyl-6-methoxyphenol hydroxylase-like FAD-dependent oxidoreductase